MIHRTKKPLLILSVLAIAAGMLSCSTTITKYSAPSSAQPSTLVKLKYKYSEVLPETNLGTRMLVRHDTSGIDNYRTVFHKEYGLLKKKQRLPKIPMSAVKIHPGKKTDLQVAMYYYWYSSETSTREVNGFPVVETCQVYHESACTVEMSFEPRENEEYLVVYNNPDAGKNSANENKLCHATLYKKYLTTKGKYKLSKIADGKAI